MKESSEINFQDNFSAIKIAEDEFDETLKIVHEILSANVDADSCKLKTRSGSKNVDLNDSMRDIYLYSQNTSAKVAFFNFVNKLYFILRRIYPSRKALEIQQMISCIYHQSVKNKGPKAYDEVLKKYGAAAKKVPESDKKSKKTKYTARSAPKPWYFKFYVDVYHLIKTQYPEYKGIEVRQMVRQIYFDHCRDPRTHNASHLNQIKSQISNGTINVTNVKLMNCSQFGLNDPIKAESKSSAIRKRAPTPRYVKGSKKSKSSGGLYFDPETANLLRAAAVPSDYNDYQDYYESPQMPQPNILILTNEDIVPDPNKKLVTLSGEDEMRDFMRNIY